MRCSDCIYWKEKWIDREERSGCHFEINVIRKDGDDFCSHFIDMREKSKEDKK